LKPKVKHPWDRWFRKKHFKLIRYRDYDSLPSLMAQQVRNNASKRKLKVTVDVEAGTIIVTNWGTKDAKSTNGRK